VILPVPGVFAATALRLFINSSIAAFNSCAAWGEKLKETEPSTRFNVRGTEDISYLLKIICNYPYYRKMLSRILLTFAKISKSDL
jgi:hypothetical protein